MTDIVHLLPDSIANQIAAGEVVQRPASVVKELIENAIDAGADHIQLIIRDAGRTLIQVIDNGKGMSATDARMAFERHATSKISKAEDLFALKTMGFRGEALPSIAAVSQVELKTRRTEDEVGTCLQLAGSKVESQEVVACAIGSSFAIKNLFFNIPARRKFLKSNDTERRNIMTEFERIILVYPEIEFSMVENDVEVLHYPSSNLKQRIVNIFGKTMNQQLLSIEVDTTIVKVTGFVGKPEFARKTRAQQFFFVNGRYMRNPYFNSAIMSAYEHLIPSDEKPNFFVYLEIDPSSIDVNIHPTKTEVKFENEQPIWQILSAATKEALGKFNEIPSIDFDTKDAIDIPINNPDAEIRAPHVLVDPNYNPFNTPSSRGGYSPSSSSYERPKMDWQQLYDGLEDTADGVQDILESRAEQRYQELPSKINFVSQHDDTEYSESLNYQYKNKYIVTSVKSGLMLIDQHRAHVQILHNQFLNEMQSRRGISQRMLFPEIIEFSPSEAAMVPYLLEDLEAIGFELSDLGGNEYSINGVPSEITSANPTELLQKMLTKSLETGTDVQEEVRETIALSLAQSVAIPSGQKLSDEEMTKIVSQLFALPQNKFTPDGKTIISVMNDDVIDKMFK